MVGEGRRREAPPYPDQLKSELGGPLIAAKCLLFIRSLIALSFFKRCPELVTAPAFADQPITNAGGTVESMWLAYPVVTHTPDM